MLGRYAGRPTAALIFAVCLPALVAAAPSASPVADAAMRGDVDAVHSLLRQGADVNAAQGDGMTALHWAARNDDSAMLEMLIYAGASPTAVTRIGDYTALHLAAKSGHAQAVEVLLRAGSSVDATTTAGGASALHFRLGSGQLERHHRAPGPWRRRQRAGVDLGADVAAVCCRGEPRRGGGPAGSTRRRLVYHRQGRRPARLRRAPERSKGAARPTHRGASGNRSRRFRRACEAHSLEGASRRNAGRADSEAGTGCRGKARARVRGGAISTGRRVGRTRRGRGQGRGGRRAAGLPRPRGYARRHDRAAARGSRRSWRHRTGLAGVRSRRQSGQRRRSHQPATDRRGERPLRPGDVPSRPRCRPDPGKHRRPDTALRHHKGAVGA